MHSNWRDCKAWHDEGLRMQTTNNQTAKLFDISLTQVVSLQQQPSFGGLKESLNSMLKSDPDFVLGRVLKQGLCFISNHTSYEGVSGFKDEVDLTFDLAAKLKDNLSEREKLHVEALMHMKDGWKIRSCDIYDKILQLHPSDFMAHKLNQQCLFFLGEKDRMRESTEAVFKDCPVEAPLHHFLYGDLGFCLCENQQYTEAEVAGRKGISLYEKDIWSIHAVAHVLEMKGRCHEGASFLQSSNHDWDVCDLFSSHIRWHNALFNVEIAEFDRALEILNEILNKHLRFNEILSFIDVTSLLCRLKLQGINVTDNLELFSKVCQSHLNDHTLTFNDLHLIIGLLGTGQLEMAEEVVQTLEDFISTSNKHDAYNEMTRKMAIPMGRGLVDYGKGDYAGAVERMGGVMGELVGIGGSDAQRDVFDQIFLDAAIQSNNPIAQDLMEKSRIFKECSPLIDRFEAKYLALKANGLKYL